MNRLRSIFILFGVATIFLSACHSSSKVRIEGKFINFPNDSLTLYRLNLSELVPVDTVITNGQGAFSTRLNVGAGFPEFYYIGHRGKTLSSLLLISGDRLSITLDTLAGIHTITGSSETQLLHEAEASMTLARHRYDSLMNHLVQLDPNMEEAKAINYALGLLYVKQKQAAIRFIFTHPRSMASVQVLFQHFSDALPLFADFRDAVYFDRLYDSLRPIYPQSPYISALRDQSDLRKRQMELNDKLINATERGFPDIVLPDAQAQPVALSLLEGNVIILSFWLSQDPSHRMANQDLLGIYQKYASKGLSVYQVALDIDKTAWARTVAEQRLPWISVCDGYGNASPSVSLYAVNQVPTYFLIDKNGDMVGRDFTVEQLATEVAKLFR